jgi:hypothetical protein
MRVKAIGGSVAAVMTALLVLGPTTSAPAAPRVKRLMPDLAPLPPDEVSGPVTAFMMPLGADAPVVIDGCVVDEKVRKGAARCLRFDGIVANRGRGPFELAFEVDASQRRATATQRIFYADGTSLDRFATETEYHPTHLHFHVKDFYVASLWNSDETGARIGVEPVAVGDKSGFCPEDSAPLKDESEGNGHYSCFTDEERGVGPWQIVGISAGWKDIYRYELPDQYVEITGVEDGFYLLELRIDPNDVFTESNEKNNVTCALIELRGPNAALVTPDPVC